jgi:GNAT superfamily N-acetyltransferase
MTSGWAAAILVAEIDGHVVGSMEFRPWGVLGITGVRPGFRRRGIGAALLAATVAEMKQRGLGHALADTHWSDADAIRLSERMGFDTSRWLHSWMRREPGLTRG